MGCYNDDVLFIHIPKCGGWSCKTYLRDNLPGILMPDDPASKLPIGHVRLQDIERFTGRTPDSFAKIIAIVRDPYEQQLSQWSFWRDRFARGGRHLHDQVAAMYATLGEFLQDPRCDFHVWYEQHHGFKPGAVGAMQQATRKVDIPAQDGVNRYVDFGGCYRYWLTVENRLPVNLVIVRQENLSEEFPKAIAEFLDGDPPAMERLNTSPHSRDTKAYYTPVAASLVEAKFAWAFDGYYPKWLYSDFDKEN